MMAMITGTTKVKMGFCQFFILGPTPVLATFKEIIPSPAKLMTAEEGEDERTQRQYVSRNNKVPKVHPGRPFSKWLEMQDIKSECCCQCQ